MTGHLCIVAASIASWLAVGVLGSLMMLKHSQRRFRRQYRWETIHTIMSVLGPINVISGALVIWAFSA
jgi:uncharacterized membrane protein